MSFVQQEIADVKKVISEEKEKTAEDSTETDEAKKIMEALTGNDSETSKSTVPVFHSFSILFWKLYCVNIFQSLIGFQYRIKCSYI